MTALCETRLYLRDAAIRLGGFVLFLGFTGTHHASARDSLSHGWWTQIKLLFWAEEEILGLHVRNARLHETSQGPVLHRSVFHGLCPAEEVT